MDFKELDKNTIILIDNNQEEMLITVKENMVINSSIFGKYELGKKLFYISLIVFLLLTVVNQLSNPSDIKIPDWFNSEKTWWRGGEYVYQPNGKYTSIYSVYKKNGVSYYSKSIDFWVLEFWLSLICFPLGVYGFTQLRKWKYNFENDKHTITLSIHDRGVNGQVSEISEETFNVGNIEKTTELHKKLSNILKSKKFN